MQPPGAAHIQTGEMTTERWETSMSDISADVNVEELVEAHPKAISWLADRGIVCIRCGEPYWGSLRELAAARSKDGDIDALVVDLNLFLEEAGEG